MPRRPARVEFLRTKYGRELLLDAAFVHELPGFRTRTARPHVLTFHDVLLVTAGEGTATLDAERHALAPGSVLFSAPGEVRRLRVPGLDGACLFFTSEFVAEAFRDPRFLERFACFRPGRPRPVLALSAAEQRTFLGRFAAMRREIAAQREDAAHALRAALYEVLVRLDRAYVARHGRTPAAGGAVERFRDLVERDFAARRRLADYARELGLSPGHLSALCRAGLGCSAGVVIRQRVVLEARRLLAYTDLTAAAVADRLGFDDPAYFARFVRRETGRPPSAFRRER